MERKDIVIGIVIVAILALVIYWLRRPETPQITVLPSPTPSIEQSIESVFNVDIPEGLEKAELKPVGDVIGTALATRVFENSKFTFSVLADLPDPINGEYYNVWISQGAPDDQSVKLTSLGKMRVAKGGWMLEYQSNTNYPDYNSVVVTQESVSDSKPETRILGGSFQ
ncbi:MAG: hypothetical protein US96_C0043G0007 [Candidatus Woesebacteria bacterium GW2011_GWB1_38_5b]|uniref:Uncharacterized protein n=1 Tax=Candidatus Woesebacteria bacterium GW2011_GWB1_38_5b TaxID=1618569 RepID=A0A0G0NA89_9BACT|nr:MAG: hypothetical protein US96_C0043G0007 [Candidatus Woesebacteria bacterium GW2011_GWB1_38_5b]